MGLGSHVRLKLKRLLEEHGDRVAGKLEGVGERGVDVGKFGLELEEGSGGGSGLMERGKEGKRKTEKGNRNGLGERRE